jgi:hypothetical protein
MSMSESPMVSWLPDIEDNGVFKDSAIKKARTLVDKCPNSDIGTGIPMKEYGQIEISEDDWVPMP